jgi:hypothetical protein
MQYSPKLKKAMEEIKGILHKHDIAATVVLHTPGFSEFLNYISPSYSCCKEEHLPDGGMQVRIVSKLADHNGDREAQREEIASTHNMLHMFCMHAGQNFLIYKQLTDKMETVIDVDRADYDAVITDHKTQNQ